MSFYKRGVNAFDDVSSAIDCATVSGLIVTYLEIEEEEEVEGQTRKMMMNKDKFDGFTMLSGLSDRETVYFIGKLFPGIFTEKFCRHIKHNVIS